MSDETAPAAAAADARAPEGAAGGRKTIVTKVTVHAPKGRWVPHLYDDMGNMRKPGAMNVEAIPPGDPVALDADEADAILARFGGEIVG